MKLKKDLSEWKIFQNNSIKDGFNPYNYQLPCSGFPALIQVDNGKDFRATLVKKFFLDNNITLEFRPTYSPNFGGYIEAPWDTINDSIRGAKLPGRVFSMPKTRDIATYRKFKIPPKYNAKQKATLTLEEFREWLFRYFTVQYCADIKACQNQSPNEIWLDGLRGDRFQPMGGALRVANAQELEQLKYYSKRNVSAKLNEKGIRYKNIYYTSEWLIEARKNGIISGQQNFRVSHLDIRYAFIVDPITRQIETLQAYNYNGDDRILSFLRDGISYKGFPITLKMLEYAKRKIGDSDVNRDDGLLLMDSIQKKIQTKKALAHKDLQFIDSIAKTQKGRKTMAQAVRSIQEKAQNQITIEEIKRNEILATISLDDLDDEEIEGYETDWNIVKNKLKWPE
ncbi:hypothetical protein [Candidatus Lokiarchaeum ossiferum]|uniref:hypothetical protein n=1 Tax=Candidatus Lokiarchaeum ossiferum TaxID=2951803 RepID=UPI00352FD9BF